VNSRRRVTDSDPSIQTTAKNNYLDAHVLAGGDGTRALFQ
jgi:hypothetical protein